VTLAASLVMAGSLLLVASVFERLGDLRSVESRSAIQRFLEQPPGSDLGLGLESVLDLLRVVAMVGAALATAAAILGYHVLKRNRAARIGLAVLAVPLFLTGTTTGGFLAALVAGSIGMLWLQPARLWFSGQAPPAERPAPAPPPVTAAPGPPQDVSAAPPPWTGYGEYGRALPAPPPVGPARSQRPSAVVAACVITWVCCSTALLFGLLLVAVLVADADGLLEELHRQNPQLAQDASDATIRATAWSVAVVVVFWSTLSGILAVLAFRRVRWSAYALVASAGTVAVVCLAGSLASPVLAVPGVLATAAGVLLLQSSAHRWYARREDPTPQPWRPSP
jgi:hypothetical protein